MTYRLSDFDYHLPADLIAQSPAPMRSGSRLLKVGSGGRGGLEDRLFTDLPILLNPDDLLVFNDSKVIPARLHTHKASGGAVEVLVERVTGVRTALVMLRASKKPVAGSQLLIDTTDTPRPAVTVLGRDPEHDDRFVLEFANPVFEVLEAYGELPLPPYIEHAPNTSDESRYQTIYAEHPGSVAAPTAGLHFDQALLNRLADAGIQTARVTLHVGSGTFSPVRHEDLSQHKMHSEWCAMSPETAAAILRTKAHGGRVVAVGTTSLRTLESAAARAVSVGDPLVAAGQWETGLFITPGYDFKVVDTLVTNFHLPKSTLLMLVSAFAGYERIREVYAHAIAHRYRFFSYGDAMILQRANSSQA